MALIDNLISYYKFDGDVLDAHGSNDGTNVGTTDTASGKINNARNFVNNNERISINNAMITLGNSNNTISFWVTIRTLSPGNSLVFFEQKSGSRRYLVYFADATNEITLLTESEAALKYTVTDINTFYHVVVTRSGTTQELWVDGVSQGTYTHADFDSSGVFEIGRNPTETTTSHDGVIDEWGIWSRALTNGEIGELYNSGAGLQYPFTTSTKLQLNIGDTWKTVDGVKINIGDVWKDVEGIQVNIGDSWKTIM